jgi:hypothetical protein
MSARIDTLTLTVAFFGVGTVVTGTLQILFA